MKLLLVLFTLFYYRPTLAAPIEINVRDYGWLTSFPALQEVLDFYIQDVENDINAEQPFIDPARINYGTANASVLSAKGLGTDYVNDPEKFLIGLGFGVALDDAKNEGIRDEISGAAATASVTVGLRINDRLMGFVNAGAFTYEQDIPGEEFEIASEIKTKNVGAHLRYDLMEKTGSEWLGWGGLKLHTGYEYNVNEIDLETTLDEDLEVDTGGLGVLAGNLTGKPHFEIETRTHSIPLELSTSLLFLKVFSLYGGLGTDLNFGQSKGKGKIEGDVAVLACTSGACVSETALPQLEAQANYDSKSQVRSVTYRAYVGFQLDLPFKFNMFVQATQMLGTEVKGVSAGLKYSF